MLWPFCDAADWIWENSWHSSQDARNETKLDYFLIEKSIGFFLIFFAYHSSLRELWYYHNSASIKTQTSDDECLELADTGRNVDLYHWSSGKFSSTWYDTLSVLVAKGRAQVAVAAANGDWPKRIRDMQYTDHEDYTVGS